MVVECCTFECGTGSLLAMMVVIRVEPQMSPHCEYLSEMTVTRMGMIGIECCEMMVAAALVARYVVLNCDATVSLSLFLSCYHRDS